MADAALDISATLTENQDRLAIFVVNTSLEPYKRTLDLTAFLPLAGEAECWTLADSGQAGERDAFNGWREPNRVRASRRRPAWATAASSTSSRLCR